MRTDKVEDRLRAGNKFDFSAFLLGAAFKAAHFFPSALPAEHGWQSAQRQRSLILYGLLAAFAALMALHLYQLQFNPAIVNANLAELKKRWQSYDTPQGKRGNILFRDGTLLAGSQKVARVIVEPTMLPGRDYTGLAQRMAALLGLPSEPLAAKLNAFHGHGLVLADDVPLETAMRITRAGLTGVFVRYYYERFYPHSDLGAAATVGYAGREPTLRLGLEKYWDAQLTGTDGVIDYSRDSHSRRIPASIEAVREAQPGRDLTTTLDSSVQLICETELRAALKQNKAQWGSIIVMQPQDGQVLGLATYPYFDPNAFAQGRIDSSERNVATQQRVEPGSTVKPLLAAMAIDRGWLPADKRFVCNRLLTINGYTVREAELSHVIGGAGGAPLEDIIVNSSNIGMAQVALALGQTNVLSAYKNYGFFSRTGIELPGEARGFEPNYYAQRTSDKPLAWPRITLANTGFGQGMAVTPLQLATAYCTIANGGYRVKPTLMLNPDQPAADSGTPDAPAVPTGEDLLAGLTGVAHAASPTQPGREQVLKPQTCQLMSSWMAEVVTRGTGKKAKLEHFRAAGKTGTAQVPGVHGGYKTGAYTASFVGFFPVENPRYVVLVMFGEPRGKYYGGDVSAPVFKAVSDRISYVQFAGGQP